jgi:hypothetical protein
MDKQVGILNKNHPLKEGFGETKLQICGHDSQRRGSPLDIQIPLDPGAAV